MERFVCSVITLTLVIVFSSSLAFASVTEAQAVKTILGESRGEPFEGQCAVGEVLRLRNSVKGFYGYTAKFKFTPQEYQTALKAWRLSATTNYSNHATLFENISSFGTPYWAKSAKKVAKIGRHTFYVESGFKHSKKK